MGDALAAHLARADPQGFDGAVHGRLGEGAARIDPLAQTDDAREGIDDAKCIAPRARHQQPAVIRAEVERSQHSIAVADKPVRMRANRLIVDVAVHLKTPKTAAARFPDTGRENYVSVTILSGFSHRSRLEAAG
jgi:hypothetical protein